MIWHTGANNYIKKIIIKIKIILIFPTIVLLSQSIKDNYTTMKI